MMNDGNEFDPESLGGVRIVMVGPPPSSISQESLSKPTKNLTQYEKNQIKFQQTAQSIGALLDSWDYINSRELLDEVDMIKIQPIMVDKLAELLQKL